jgi:predicted transcriptional regulator
MQFSELQTILRGMSRQETNALADAADVPQSTVAKIRKGHTSQPRVTTVEALSKALVGKFKPKKTKRMCDTAQIKATGN